MTSCGSRCASEAGGGSLQQPATSQIVVTSELSKHEKASNWLISLPPGGGGVRLNHSGGVGGHRSAVDDPSGKETVRFWNTATKSSDRLKDCVQDMRNSSRSMICDENMLVLVVHFI